jgi:pyruvate-formate lyase-activating enzyme
VTLATDTPACVTVTQFKELWIHTGTACNLQCPFCLEGSKPGDDRLQPMTLADVEPHLLAAVALGVQRFAFTGGEPLIVKEIAAILGRALALRPCLLVTNGTAPLIKRPQQLLTLKQHAHPLTFCISVDHPDERRHDAGRGWGNFKRAMAGLKILHAAGFAVCVARQALPDEVSVDVQRRYAELLRQHGLPPLALVALPEFGAPGSPATQPPPTVAQLADSAAQPMCARSRMLVKRSGTVCVYACPLTDDDARFNLGASLDIGLQQPVELRHPRCWQCLRHPIEHAVGEPAAARIQVFATR